MKRKVLTILRDCMDDFLNHLFPFIVACFIIKNPESGFTQEQYTSLVPAFGMMTLSRLWFSWDCRARFKDLDDLTHNNSERLLDLEKEVY